MKNVFYAVACLSFLTACSDSDSERIEPTERLHPVQFSVQLDKEILPFSSTRSMPEVDVAEPTAVEPELSDLCSVIEYIVYNSDDAASPVKRRTYNTDAEDFGIVYDTLPEGNYRVCFLAHQAEDVSFADNIFSFDEMTDTFYDTASFTIGEDDESLSQDITLERIVCRIEFCATDAVPENVKRFDISVTNHASKLGILSGEGIASADEKKFSYTFVDTDVSETGKTHSFLTFTPAEGTKLTAVISSVGADEEVLRSWTVSNISPISDKIIRYTGTLYTPPGPNEAENTFSLSIGSGGQWSDEEEIELTE